MYLRCIAVFFALIAYAAGCTAPPPRMDAANPETATRANLNVWGWNIAAASLENLIPDFNEAYPDINVSIYMSGTDMQSRFLLSLVAGVGAPDISQLQLVDAPRFGPSGRMMDLTDLAEKYASRFSPAFWQNCVYDGRIYAIPWDMGPCAVFYKRDIFARYGLDPDTIETWEDYIAAGKHIVAASNAATRMLPLSAQGLIGIFEILIQQNGGGVFDAEGRIIICSQENIEALEILRGLLCSGITTPVDVFSHEYLASLQNDTVATYPMAVWFGGSVKDYAGPTAGNWGVFRLPAFRPGGLRTSNLGGSVLVIPEQGKNKEAAWKFVEYVLCTEAAQLAQYRHFDLFPCLMSTFDDPFFDEPDPFYGNQKVRRLFATDIEKIPVLTRTEDWNQALRYIGQGLSQWHDSQMDHDRFLREMERKLARKLGREVAGRAGP